MHLGSGECEKYKMKYGKMDTGNDILSISRLLSNKICMEMHSFIETKKEIFKYEKINLIKLHL